MTTWNSEDFFGSSEDSASSVTTKLPAARKATPEEDELYRKRDPWERFKDAYTASALHNPIGAEGAMRYLGVNRPKGVTDNQLNKAERVLSDRYSRKAEADPAFRGPAQLGAVNSVADFVGSLLGGVDPTYAIAPGRTVAQRIAAQSGVNAGQDALSQAIELHRGVRDNFDPKELLLNATVGGVTQGTVEGVHSYKLGRAVQRGSSHPDWAAVNSVIVNDLEGGGTLANPKTSPKGATGPQQVMPETARDPGFGIRPWNGKTQSDLARVGRQYSAAMMDKYDGDTAKVFAAYNAGPGRLDAAIEAHGSDWLRHMPLETKKYVRNGINKINQGPDNLGEIDLVRGEQPSLHDQADINQRLSPSDELAADLPRLEDSIHYENDGPFEPPKEGSSDLRAAIIDTDGNVHVGKPGDIHMNVVRDMMDKGIPENKWGASGFVDKEGNFLTKDQAGEKYGVSDATLIPEHDNVVDLDNIRHAKDYQMAAEQIDQIHDMSARLRDATVEGHRLDTAKAENTRSLINDELQNYEPGTSVHNKLLESDDMLKEAIAHSGVKPRIYAPDASEKFLSGEPSTDAANLNDDRYVGKLPKEGYTPAVRMNDGRVHVGTSAEGEKGWVSKDGTFLTNDEAHKTAEFEAFAIGRDIERDTNPPASSATFGTKRPEGINPRSSAPPKGEAHEDLKAVRSQKKLVLDRLGDLLDQSAPIRREAEDAISKERSRRLAAAFKAQKKAGGREGLYQALGAMKGEMGRPRIQSIADQFTPEEINGLIDGVWNSPKLEGYEHIRAAKALDKLLGAQYGEIPTASEVALLSKAMPEKASVWRRLMENEEGSVPLPEEGAIKRGVVNVLGLTRTLKASFDVSAPGRQGMFLIGSKQYWKALPGMFKSFASEGKFHEMQEEIRNRPTYDLMNKAGLEITKNDGSIIDREEAFVSQFAEKIPGVRSSERAYLGFLNKLRADMFDDFVRRGDQLGLDFIHDPHYLKSAARFINAATGRGSVKWMGRNGELLSKALFSPKLMASRVQLLNPGFYAGLHPNVRAQAAKHGLIYASTVMTALGLAAAAGAQVEWDPRSSDFAKIKVGNTRFDVTGGFQPYVRFYAQFLLGQQKGINDSVVRNVGWVPPVIRKYLPGEDQPAFKPTTRKDVVYRFIENKESPNASEVTRLLQGSDAVGNPLTPQSEATNLFAPLIIQDTYQAYQDLGAKGLLTAIPNAVGVGIQTYTPKAKKSSGISGKEFGFSKSDFGGNTWSAKDFQ